MSKPNIVLIITDDQTFESISRMQGVFSRIAKNGVLFSNCYTATSLCQPGRSTLHTGQFCHNHHVIDNRTSYTVLDESKLLGKVLKNAGYHTGYVGKYLNNWTTADPIPAGYDEWHCTSPQDAYNYNINDNGSVTAKGSATADHQTLVVASRAIDFINATSTPFFLGIGFNAPHFNSNDRYAVDPTADYKGCVPTSKTFPKKPNWDLADVTSKPTYIKALPRIDGATESGINSFYRDSTESLFGVSKAINQIVDSLVAAGKYDNTYIIYTSDNGEMYGEQRITTGKIVPYEESIHIPLVISGPSASVSRDKTCNQMVSHVDIFPTIIELAGATALAAVDGVSLVPYLVNPQAAAARSHVIIEWESTVSTPAGNPSFSAVRSLDWKYIEYANGEKELYDLRTNPYELANTVELPENAAVVAELSALVARGKSCSGASCVF